MLTITDVIVISKVLIFASLGINVGGLTLPAKSCLGTVCFCGAIEDFLLVHHVAVAAHALEVEDAIFRVITRHVVNTVHMVLSIALYRVIHRKIKLKCLSEDLVLTLV